MMPSRVGIVAAAWMLVCTSACTATRSPATDARDVAGDSIAVASLVRDRLRAALAGDTALWHQHVSDDAIWTGPALAVATTRDVLVSLGANRALAPATQQIEALVVYLRGDIAHASYVQTVSTTGGDVGKRFRKTDTYRRAADGWVLIAATEISIAERGRAEVDDAQLHRLAGAYVLGSADTLVIAAVGNSRLVLTGGGATPDTLIAESDSVFFQDGDRGAWIFARENTRDIVRLVYRASGQDDVVLRRIAPRLVPAAESAGATPER